MHFFRLKQLKLQDPVAASFERPAPPPPALPVPVAVATPVTSPVPAGTPTAVATPLPGWNLNDFRVFFGGREISACFLLMFLDVCCFGSMLQCPICRLSFILSHTKRAIRSDESWDLTEGYPTPTPATQSQVERLKLRLGVSYFRKGRCEDLLDRLTRLTSFCLVDFCAFSDWKD